MERLPDEHDGELSVLLAYERSTTKTLGILLALLFLARLDTAIFVAAPLLCWGIASKDMTIGRAVRVGVPLGIAFAVYAAINLMSTGHVVPISSVIKSSFPAISWKWGFLREPFNIASMFGWMTLVTGLNIVVCLGLLAVALILISAAGLAFPNVRKILGLAIVCAALCANLLLFQRWEKSIDPRYFVLPSIAGVFVLAVGLDLFLQRRVARAATNLRASVSSTVSVVFARLTPMVLLGLLGVEILVGARTFATRAHIRDNPVRDIFEAIAARLPPTAILAGTDVGAMSFWTQLPVVNLDGVMNNFDYQRRLRDGGLQAYLRERGVTDLGTTLWDRVQTYTSRPVEPMYRHVIDPLAQRSKQYPYHLFYVYSYAFQTYSDSIKLYPQQEVYRRVIGIDGVAHATYVVYALAR